MEGEGVVKIIVVNKNLNAIVSSGIYSGSSGIPIKGNNVITIAAVVAVVAIIITNGLLVILMLIYLSFAAASALAPWVGEAVGFLIVAGAYFLLLLLFITFRKQWIEKPLVKFLASILLS